MTRTLLHNITFRKNETFEKVLPIFRPLLTPDTIFLFQGHIGAGKTFLIQAVLKSFYNIKQVTSPTFTYVKKYPVTTQTTISHYDLYRLKSIDDLIALGCWQDFFEEKQIVFVEWPEILWPFLAEISAGKTIYLVNINSEVQTVSEKRTLAIYKITL